MILVSVDLPLPFSPSRACTSPFSTLKSTPSSALTPGKLFEMAVIAITCVAPHIRRSRHTSRMTSSGRETALPPSPGIHARTLLRIVGLEGLGVVVRDTRRQDEV